MPNLPEYLPTPEQIEDECECIRARWSWQETQRRVVSPPDRKGEEFLGETGWTPPEFSARVFDVEEADE